MFEKQRLSNQNLDEYAGFYISKKLKTISQVPCLLQNDYGEENDCTLTSLTAIVKYYQPAQEIATIYTTIESTAQVYGFYRGSYGTCGLLIGLVYNKVLKKFKINKKAQGHLLKDIGYNFAQIQNEINQNHPVLLNLWKDGREYYKNHSVLVIGYIADKDRKFLAIYDNWNDSISYIDYDKLSVISSIHTLQDK